MWKYFLKRLVIMLVAMFLIILLTFIIMHSIPGGPFTSNKQVSEEVEAALNAKYNLDAPLYEQFFSYLKNILHGDFGPSYKYTGKTVNDFIYSFDNCLTAHDVAAGAQTCINGATSFYSHFHIFYELCRN